MKNRTKISFCSVTVFVLAFTASVLFTDVYSNSIFPDQSVTAQAATIGEKNALAKAKAYLDTMPFSKKGLIKQLKFDGFTAKESKYAANKCKANWKEQAAKKAKLYLETQAFSKAGLIKQLKFDGFTAKEAKYGVKKAGY